jgi:predicted SnoaL-like aldol condensation-catalyzing enzyme
MVNDPEQNKQTAQNFYDLMFNQCRPREAIEKYAGDEYIQHNPEVADGKEAFIAYFERMATDYPGKKVHFPSGRHCSESWPERGAASPRGRLSKWQ